VEYADLDKDDATGHVHIQIMKVPPLARFPEANWDIDKPPSPEHALAAYNAYNAYFGTYTVDAKRHVVIDDVSPWMFAIPVLPFHSNSLREGR
jgi:hypothetical protein